jgi:hypothetical protein
MPHQLARAAFLRRVYLQEQEDIIADNQALGVAATVLQFLRACALTLLSSRTLLEFDSGALLMWLCLPPARLEYLMEFADGTNRLFESENR